MDMTKSYVCLPLASNIIASAELSKKHPDWRLVDCPICGAKCWESDMARIVLETGAKGACTICALKNKQEKEN